MKHNMNARQFLIDTSEKISIAVDNGMDIRMDESEWLQKMEEYADAKVRKLNLSGIGSKQPCKWNGNLDACGNEVCWDLQECQGNPVACASGGEDTVAEARAIIAECKKRGNYCGCGDECKLTIEDVRKSSEGQP
jgi:hypothetical protein